MNRTSSFGELRDNLEVLAANSSSSSPTTPGVSRAAGTGTGTPPPSSAAEEVGTEANEDEDQKTQPSLSLTTTTSRGVQQQSAIKPPPPCPSPSSSATTPEPTSSSSIGGGSALSFASTSSSSLFSWYSNITLDSFTGGGIMSNSSSGAAATPSYDTKTYRTYVQSIDKCLKNFEYSIEWPDLISALTKLNKVISNYNSAVVIPSAQQQQASHTSGGSTNSSLHRTGSGGSLPSLPPPPPPPPPPPLPRTHLITKRLSQCLHPNLPSGVHLRTLEVLDTILQGFKYHDYVHLERDLFSFLSGILPLWSYAMMSVKPKLLTIYETHLVVLGSRLRPALNGIMLSLFNGLVDDGVEQDIKIRITSLLSALEQSNRREYFSTLNSLIAHHPSIHFPVISHMTQISYLPPPHSLIHLISSPNTLVQRNGLELLNKSYDLSSLDSHTQVLVARTAIQSLAKRDMSVSRRVFSFIEPRQDLIVLAVKSLIREGTDGSVLTRILSILLDNPSITVLDEILAPVVKYLMNSHNNTVSVSFLSTIKPSFLCKHFTTYLFDHSGLEDLENRVIVFNYVVKLNLFEFDYDGLFERLAVVSDDSQLRVILQMIRVHYNSHEDAFVTFYNNYMARYFDLSAFSSLLRSCDYTDDITGCSTVTMNHHNHGCSTAPEPSDYYTISEYSDLQHWPAADAPSPQPPATSGSWTSPSTSFELVSELMLKSTPDPTASQYIILSAACSDTPHVDKCVDVYIHFQDVLQPLVHQTTALALIFKHCYDTSKWRLNRLRYPEKLLLSELHSDDQLRSAVVELDLSNSPLVVLKIVDPGTMATPYRRFVARQFVASQPGLVLNSILRYLEFHVEAADAGGSSTPTPTITNNKSDAQQPAPAQPGSVSRAKSESNLTTAMTGGHDTTDFTAVASATAATTSNARANHHYHAQSVLNVNEEQSNHAPAGFPGRAVAGSCSYDSARVTTLLEKLDFVVDVSDGLFLSSIDLTVLLSKLTVLSTIWNDRCSSSSRESSTTLGIQTRALATIARVIRTHGEPAHSFVYDSLLSHVTKQQQQHRSGTGTPGSVQVHNTSTTTTALLWELSAIPVISEFLKFDLENYTLALVVQRALNTTSSAITSGDSPLSPGIRPLLLVSNHGSSARDPQHHSSTSFTSELVEQTHVSWLHAIAANLPLIRKHLNAVVLITFTSVCKNLLDEQCTQHHQSVPARSSWSRSYVAECVNFLNTLLRNVLSPPQEGSAGHHGAGGGSSGGSGGSGSATGGSSTTSSSTPGFLSSLFGGGSSKDQVVDEREALRIALLGKLDSIVRIACRLKGAGWSQSSSGAVVASTLQHHRLHYHQRQGYQASASTSPPLLPCSVLIDLLRFVCESHENQVLSAIHKCYDTPHLELVAKELRISSGKICSGILAAASSSNSTTTSSITATDSTTGSSSKLLDGLSFLTRYLRHDRSLDVQTAVAVCKACSTSTRHVLTFISEYVRVVVASGGSSSKVSREIQDLVVRTLETAVERREFPVLESWVPGIFDLVWGDVSGGANLIPPAAASSASDDMAEKSSTGGLLGSGGGSGGASSASVRDQKIIVNVVHGIVVAVLVAVKGMGMPQAGSSSSLFWSSSSSSAAPDNATRSSSSSSYTSALRVLEQISHHTYLRKAWKKEIFDLITNEPTFFFFFSPECLATWKVIVDNLFTQDRTTFSELLTRLTQTTQLSTSALSTIFSTKDPDEACGETRSLKRLAFVIHASEKDQYAKYITNIQEKIAEALKVAGTSGAYPAATNNNVNNNIAASIIMMNSNDRAGYGGGGAVVPGVTTSVFLCFRVMVLKFNSNILVSLWPIIVHEVVMVLNTLQCHLEELVVAAVQQQQQQMQLQQQEDQSSSSLSSVATTTESVGTTTSTQLAGGSSSGSSPALSLYLQSLKLLNFLFTIKSTDSQIPHFQLYKWAFTDDDDDDDDDHDQADHTMRDETPGPEECQVYCSSGGTPDDTPRPRSLKLNVNACTQPPSFRLSSFSPYLRRLRATAQLLYPSLQCVTPPLRIRSVSSMEELCSAFGCLEQEVPEHEWETVDFCDAATPPVDYNAIGRSGSSSQYYNTAAENTDL